MRPPYCEICGMACIDDLPPNEGGWIQFADYVSSEDPWLSGAIGSVYFCGAHVAAARSLKSRPMEEALLALKAQFGSFPPYPRGLGPTLWQRLIKKLRAWVCA